MSATNPNPPLPMEWATPPDIKRASDKVNISGCDARLQQFIARLNCVHYSLFGLALVVTSGRDAIHGNGSKHYIGKAVDIRTHDKTEAQCLTLLAILNQVAPSLGLGIFDERALGDESHIHIELAD